MEREEEGKAGPVTGGESWDSSESSEKGVLVCSRASSEMERWSRCFAGSVFKERRPGESQDGAGAGRRAAGPVSQERRQEKRVKWSRETAACLRMCSLDTLQSA